MATTQQLESRLDGLARAYLQLVGVLLDEGMNGDLLVHRLNSTVDTQRQRHPECESATHALERLAIQIEDSVTRRKSGLQP